jgi:xylulose-5-phosphate/fructose-6-phosphate phosphoketolase
MVDTRLRARQYTREHGEDMPEVSRWTWPHNASGQSAQPGLSGADFAGQTAGSSNQDTASDFG